MAVGGRVLEVGGRGRAVAWGNGGGRGHHTMARHLARKLWPNNARPYRSWRPPALPYLERHADARVEAGGLGGRG